MTFEEQFAGIKAMFSRSDCDIAILPPDAEKTDKLRGQGSDFTPLAAILAGTGGVCVNGMLRLCGCGAVDFFERNERLSEMGLTIVAEDVFGGIFGLDKHGMVMYFAPDELAVEEFGADYPELLEWLCCREDIERFYRDYRRECPDVIFEQIPADKGLSLYPPLWESSDEKRSAAAVPIAQLQDVEIEICKKQSEGGKKE